MTLWRWSLAERWLMCVLLGLVCAVLSACGSDEREVPNDNDNNDNNDNEEALSIGSGDSRDVAGAEAADAGPSLFTEISHTIERLDGSATWPDGRYHTPEIIPGGVALLDYDNDGLLDVYQVCHGPPGDLPDPFGAAAPNRLFRQTRDGRFVEVEGAAGLNDPGFGHGAAIGDVDSDGDMDVYVTNFGVDRFFVNEGDGRFRDATDEAGFAGDAWSSAASFFDYDADGDLDLFVVHFAVYDLNKRCSPSGDANELEYCGPHTFAGVADTLYRNEGNGRFTDVSQAVGITAAARGWGVVTADFTGDDLPDIYVANDEEPNQLWVNQGNGSFMDEGMLRGVAVNATGNVEASMGVALGDVNGDGAFDLLVTHITLETNTLYLGGKNQLFSDRTAPAGMAGDDRPFTGWGCGLFDYDHDGDLDVAVVNGRVFKGIAHPDAKLPAFWARYAEPNLLFAGDGAGRFTNVSDTAGAFASTVEVTRGLALGDLDNDGDMDLVTNTIDNTLRIYRNDAPKAGRHWLGVRAMVGERDAYGAVVIVDSGGRSQRRLIQPSYSYLSSNDHRAHFGLGDASEINSLIVIWPGGQRERFAVDAVDRYVTVVAGQGAR